MFLLIFLLCVWPYSCQDVISVEKELIGNQQILKDLEDCKEANRVQENSIRDFQEKWSHKEGLLCPATINVNTQNRQDLQDFQNIRSMEECSIKCLETPTCNFWSWHHRDAGKWAFDCVLMSGFGSTHLDYNVISGAKNCPRAPLEPIEVTVHGKSNLTYSQTSNFSCSAQGGRPPFEISLKEVSKEVTSRDTINVTAKKDVKQIILICIVKDIYGFTSQAIKVIPILVGPNPSLIHLLHKGNSKIVEAGSVQDYECLTGGATPAPNIDWKILDQTGQELVVNETSKTETENGGYSKIQVFMKENWTNLTITCIVSNDVGYESKSLDVPIISQGAPVTVSMLPSQCYAKSSHNNMMHAMELECANGHFVKTWDGCIDQGSYRVRCTHDTFPCNFPAKNGKEFSCWYDCADHGGFKNCSLYDPVDCSFSNWSMWSTCNVSCGGGVQSRVRGIKQEALHGGDECSGKNSQQQQCNQDDCPGLDMDDIDGEVGEGWVWDPNSIEGLPPPITDIEDSSKCCEECQKGQPTTALFEFNTLLKFCSCYQWNTTSGKRPISVQGQSNSANGICIPVDCSFSNWSMWSTCNVSCGGGVQSRVRRIIQEALRGGDECSGENSQEQQCNEDECPVDCSFSNWSTWSTCNVSCDGGVQSRVRGIKQEALHGGDECSGENSQERQCTQDDCPVDCSFSNWSTWSTCNVSCGGGVQSRDRTIIQEALHGGDECSGENSQEQQCNQDDCPSGLEVFVWDMDDIDGEVGEGWAWDPNSIEGLLPVIMNIEDSSKCCEECQREQRTTTLFEFNSLLNFCACYQRNTTSGNLPISVKGQPFSANGICNILLGKGRRFTWNSVDHLGTEFNLTDSSSCSKYCKTMNPKSQMFEFDHVSTPSQCWCFKTKGGHQATTWSDDEFFADIC